MEIGYGLPTTQLGMIVDFPGYAYANQGQVVVAETLSMIAGIVTVVPITGNVTSQVINDVSVGGNNPNYPGVLAVN